MMGYIKSQISSDEAEPTISTVFIIAFVIVAAVWLFTRIFAATERKGADVSNCIGSSTTLSKDASASGQNCTDTNSSGKTYNYGSSLS